MVVDEEPSVRRGQSLVKRWAVEWVVSYACVGHMEELPRLAELRAPSVYAAFVRCSLLLLTIVDGRKLQGLPTIWTLALSAATGGGEQQACHAGWIRIVAQTLPRHAVAGVEDALRVRVERRRMGGA